MVKSVKTQANKTKIIHFRLVFKLEHIVIQAQHIQVYASDQIVLLMCFAFF